MENSRAQRHITHRDSSFHTPTIVTSHTNYVFSRRLILCIQKFIRRPKTCNSILSQFNSPADHRSAKWHRPFWPINMPAPPRVLDASPRPPPLSRFETHQKQMRLSKAHPCLIEALRPSRTWQQGVGARHARMLSMLRVAPLPRFARPCQPEPCWPSAGLKQGTAPKADQLHFPPRVQ